MNADFPGQAAAQRAYDNATPADPGDLIDGEVNLWDENAVHEFITDGMGDEFLPVDVAEVMALWLASSRDQYALAKFNREMYGLAQRVERAIDRHNEQVRDEDAAVRSEMRDFFARWRSA